MFDFTILKNVEVTKSSNGKLCSNTRLLTAESSDNVRFSQTQGSEEHLRLQFFPVRNQYIFSSVFYVVKKNHIYMLTSVLLSGIEWQMQSV